ncbi:hypothetical protein BH09SUM1_BH09SUM1_02440 [soil metagenome]
MGIKIILIAGTIGLLALMMRRRTVLQERLLGVLLGCLIILAVVLPNLTNTVANALGVGRGADLVFYCSFLMGCYLSIQFYGHLRDQDRKLTELTRAIAIAHAKSPASAVHE